MTTIQMAPGATVISASTHGGLERVSSGAVALARLLRAAARSLATWREAHAEALQAARMVELAAHDPRVLAELRAALDRGAR